MEKAEESSPDRSSEGNYDAFTNFNNPMSTTPYKATLNTNQSEESDEVMQLPKIPLEEKFVSLKSCVFTLFYFLDTSSHPYM